MNFRANGKYWSYVAVVLLVGLFVRSYDLGNRSFHWDEMYHVLAAQSYLQTGEFILPQNRIYKRSPITTYLGAVSFKWLGVSELSARIFPLTVSILHLILFAFFVKKYFGQFIGFLSLTLFALSPFCVDLSRNLRYYSEWMLACTLIFFLLLPYLEKSYSIKQVLQLLKTDRIASIGLLLVPICALIVKNDNQLGLTIFIALVAVSMLRMLFQLWKNGPHDIYLKTDFIIISSLCIVLIVTLIFFPETLKKIYWTSQTLARSAAHNESNYLYYLEHIGSDYPLFLFLVSLGAYNLIRNYAWRGVYVLMAFTVPLIILSNFSWKVDRYSAFIYPFLFILIASGFAYIKARICIFYEKRSDRSFHGTLYIYLIILSYFVVSPWTSNLFKVVDDPVGIYEGLQSAQFREAASELNARNISQVEFVTRSPYLFYYYFSRVPKYMFVEVTESQASRIERFHASGSRRVFNAKELYSSIRENGPLIVVMSKKSWNSPFIVSDSTHRTVNNLCEKIELRSAPSVLAFYCNDR